MQHEPVFCVFFKSVVVPRSPVLAETNDSVSGLSGRKQERHLVAVLFMEKLNRDRNTSILIGIGLVLIGLLGGILVMLFFVDRQPQQAFRVVERVELGRSQPLPAVSTPDSGDASTVVDLRTFNHWFKEVARQITQTVVYIQVESSGDELSDWFHQFEEEELGRRFREMPRQSVGSGVIISEQGYLVTNHHVVDRASRIQVTLSDKRQFQARLVGVDPSTDLAVLQVTLDEGETLPAITFGNSDAVQVGEWVLAVGNPFRLTSTVTAGIVSALGRQVNIIEDKFRIEDFIQTDAAINPGNSGGALVNLQGELIGISTAIATESGSYEGYGFAVPVNLVERVVQDLITYGEVQRGYLGVTIQSIDASDAQRLGLDHIGGVYLDEVEGGSAAYLGGLRQGDVVLSVAGRSVNEPNELQSSIARHRPGDYVLVEVWRKGRTQTLQIELLGRDDPAMRNWISSRDAEPLSPNVLPRRPSLEVFQLEGWGIGIRELTRRERDGFDVEQGVYLSYIEAGTAAAEAGLPRDVIIERIDDEPITSVEEVVRQLGGAAAETVLLRVKRRNGLAAFYEMKVPQED